LKALKGYSIKIRYDAVVGLFLILQIARQRASPTTSIEREIMLLEMMLVIAITDGETVKVLSKDNQQLKIRLAAIDAPERKQPFGAKSKQMLSSFIGNERVNLDCPSKDRYNRLICTIRLRDGTDVNRAMVANGGAWVYRHYYKGSDYLNAEKQARDNGLGLWNTSEYKAIEPWKWRKQKHSF